MSLFSLGILIAIGTENFLNKLTAKLIEFLYSLSDSYLFHSFIHSSTKYLHIMHCSKHSDVAKNKTNQKKKSTLMGLNPGEGKQSKKKLRKKIIYIYI